LRFNSFDARFSTIDSSIRNLDSRLQTLEVRTDDTNSRLEKLEIRGYDTKPIWERALKEIAQRAFAVQRICILITHDRHYLIIAGYFQQLVASVNSGVSQETFHCVSCSA
jgi:hypothetical protein